MEGAARWLMAEGKARATSAPLAQERHGAQAGHSGKGVPENGAPTATPMASRWPYK